VSDLYASEPCPPFELGRARPLIEHERADAAILALGTMAIESKKAIDLLNGEYKVNLYDARFARPVDVALLARLIEARVPVITVEDHGLEGGFGSCVIDACHDLGLDSRLVTRMGLPCRWIYQGSRSLQLEDAGIDGASIARRVREVLDRTERSPIVTTIAQPPRERAPAT
jgi:1-deoxy-D-xylulose-5-phosphate synthase